MAAVRAKVSGGAAAEQLKDELAVLTEAEWRELLLAADCSAEIPTDETLAMKADPVLPWKKMRIMRR